MPTAHRYGWLHRRAGSFRSSSDGSTKQSAIQRRLLRLHTFRVDEIRPRGGGGKALATPVDHPPSRCAAYAADGLGGPPAAGATTEVAVDEG